MSMIMVTVVYGGNTDFTEEKPASDGKQEWVNSDFVTNMRQNQGTLNPGGAIFRYQDPGQAYPIEYRAVETPVVFAASDIS